MPDIIMCSGDGCPLKETCYRFKATPGDFRQSWFAQAPVDENGRCAYYWPTKEEA